MLQMVGHDVRVCYDGVNALTQAERLFRPEVMLLDIGIRPQRTRARLHGEWPWGARMQLIAWPRMGSA